MEKSDIGIVGLAVMGENLALNFESRGYRVSVYNRTTPGREDAVAHFLEGRGKGKRFYGTREVAALAQSLRTPRVVLLMIRAGDPVDEMIGKLVPVLSPGDVIIDGGNSYFKDTARREHDLAAQGILFVGAGISGGEEGALHGPSIMPGGNERAWPVVKPFLQAVAARLPDGTPCCQWIGPGGAGHFVKTVHNGIEYGDMELIAEAYQLLRTRENFDNGQLAATFKRWNEGELSSYLIGITAEILRFREADGGYLVDRILDVAGQKGTGRWSAETALEEDEPLTLITEAVYARMLSALKEEREHAAEYYPANPVAGGGPGADATGGALYAAKLVSYAQGFSLLRRASLRYDWKLDYGTIAMVWREGCIIRSAFLEKITEAYRRNPELENLLFDGFFRERVGACLPSWRKVVTEGMFAGIALPCMASGLSWFDGLRAARSPANLLQAQRDYFGAHTFERTDAPRGRFFHNDWTGSGGDTTSGTYNA